MSVSNPQSPTPPLHAEVRETVKFLVSNAVVFTKDNTTAPNIRVTIDGATDAILQAVADALLAGLPEKPKRTDHMIDNGDGTSTSYSHDYEFGYNAALDAVTRVIGELGGPVSDEGATGL